MHTTRVRNTSFIHHGDFGGNVRILRGKRNREGDMVEPIEELEVPFADLAEFVAEYVRSQRIEELENLSTAKVLGVRLPR